MIVFLFSVLILFSVFCFGFVLGRLNMPFGEDSVAERYRICMNCTHCALGGTYCTIQNEQWRELPDKGMDNACEFFLMRRKGMLIAKANDVENACGE